MELGLFDEVAEAVRSMVPDHLAPLHLRARRYGIKVWLGPAEPPREHYEAQVIGASLVDEAEVLALEIGFHAENRNVGDNDEVIDALAAREDAWRPVLGERAVAGPFLGRADDWRRLSETWPDPDLGDDDLAVEVAGCLVDYMTTLEPLRSRDR
jgi:hypothetical protein